MPQRGVIRAAVPFGRVHIDFCGSLKPALDGSVYMTMFGNSASWQQWTYEMRANSDVTKYVKRSLADMNGMGTPACFCMHGGGEFTGREFAEVCDAAGIHRDHTAPGTSNTNGVGESAIWRAFKDGHIARRHILYNPHVDLSAIPNMDPDGHRLWLASAIWTPGCFNRSPTKASIECLSPYEVFLGRKPPLKVVLYFKRG